MVDVQDQLPVFGRTVVVHSAAANNPRVGCGVIGGGFQVTRAYVSTTRYPGYSPSSLIEQPHMVAHLSMTGTSGHFCVPDDWLIHTRKAGSECPRCDGTIEKSKVGGRSAYHCTRHQK